jgi:hypothetical protein
MSEIESAVNKLMEAIEINASLIGDAKSIVIDPSKPVDSISGKDILSPPRTLTEVIANMARQIIASNDELRDVRAVLYRTLGPNVHLE